MGFKIKQFMANKISTSSVAYSFSREPWDELNGLSQHSISGNLVFLKKHLLGTWEWWGKESGTTQKHIHWQLRKKHLGANPD